MSYWVLRRRLWAAPFGLETETSLFMGSGGRKGLRLEVERVCQIAPTLTLTPELKANLHSKNNIQTGIGSGLSELEIGLRLAYQATPTFSPYVGIAWGKPYGKTSDFARAEGEHGGNTQFLMGFSFELWFPTGAFVKNFNDPYMAKYTGLYGRSAGT